MEFLTNTQADRRLGCPNCRGPPQIVARYTHQRNNTEEELRQELANAVVELTAAREQTEQENLARLEVEASAYAFRVTSANLEAESTEHLEEVEANLRVMHDAATHALLLEEARDNAQL